MSCIPKILELKGDKNVLPVPSLKREGYMRGIVIEDGGNYKGYDYLITVNDMGFRCGYVALPSDHPINSFHEEKYNYPDLDVHGGITFFNFNHLSEVFFGEDSCNDKWIGFDCGHGGDYFDLSQARIYFNDDPEILRRIDSMLDIKDKVGKEMEQQFSGHALQSSSFADQWREIHRTKEYVINECKNLIDQLIEKAA